jgi:hypothetical protein
MRNPKGAGGERFVVKKAVRAGCPRRTAVVCALVLAAALAVPAGAQSNYVAKQVHLVNDGAKLFASNIKLNRFDELKLDAQERVLDQQEGAGVAVVVTNQRIVAYGVLSGWRSMDRIPNEQVESIMAEDYAGFVVTSIRMLNFNGETGVFAERKRAINR